MRSGKSRHLMLGMLAAALAVFQAWTVRGADTAAADQTLGPRELYNGGTRKLSDGKVADAEIFLQEAVASQDEKVQAPALYNLGLARFEDGENERTNARQPAEVKADADSATNSAAEALKSGEAALAGEDTQAMVDAYLRGRGARKELKAAMEAVKQAMETYGSVLTKWRLSSGDFRSAAELHAGDKDAQFNAGVVDRHIAQLVDEMKPMASSRDKMDTLRQQLGQMMQKLKGKMPEDTGTQMPGDDDEDDDGNTPPRQLKGAEGPERNGSHMELTRDEAMRLLNLLRLDEDRKLSQGVSDEPTKPLDRKGKDW